MSALSRELRTLKRGGKRTVCLRTLKIRRKRRAQGKRPKIVNRDLEAVINAEISSVTNRGNF